MAMSRYLLLLLNSEYCYGVIWNNAAPSCPLCSVCHIQHRSPLVLLSLRARKGLAYMAVLCGAETVAAAACE